MRKKLATLAREELNEDMDPSLFAKVLQRRIKGLSLGEAKKALQGDAAELEQWLKQPGKGEERLHFFLGFLLIGAESPEKLARVSGKAPKPRIEMRFPANAKAKELHGGWKVRWRGFTLFVLPSVKECFEGEIEMFREPVEQHAKLISVSVVPVRFGDVSGFKQVEVITEVGAKHVKYALRVPGGYATAAILKKGVEWEEAVFDEWLSSMRLVQV